MELLQLAGFELNDTVVAFPAKGALDEAQRVCELLEDALRDYKSRWEQACAGDGTATAETGSGARPAATPPSNPGSDDGGGCEPRTTSAQGASNGSRGGCNGFGTSPGSGLAANVSAAEGGLEANAEVRRSGGRSASPGGGSGGGPATSSGSVDVPRASPWSSSLVQKQLSRMPAVARQASPLAGSSQSREARWGGSGDAAHPAEAKAGSQEPQSGG